MRSNRMNRVVWTMVVIAIGLMGSRASAAVVGTVNLANTSGGGISLTSSSIDFLLPAAGGNGAMATGIGTNVGYMGGGPLVSGANGLLKDFSIGSLPVLDFATFATDPNLHFDLTGIGPGVLNTTAVNTFDPNTAPSSPSVGSPYILQATATGTSLTFTVSGIARDLSSPDSFWTGMFTTQIAGATPFQIQQVLINAGTVSSTYSASFIATGTVPEPTAALLLAGLVPMLSLRRRR